MKWMDMHCDTVSELFRKRSEGTLWKNKLCVDIERLKKSDSVAQFFACYVNAAEYPGWEEAFDAAEKLIQSVHEEEALQDQGQNWKQRSRQRSMQGYLR